jgi:hypothetical protein
MIAVMAGNLTPSQRSMRARIAANVRHSRGDGREAVAPARRGFDLAMERRVVDPSGTLDPKGSEYAAARDAIPAGELERRVRSALKAHMTTLALKRSRKRSSKAA